MKKRIISILMSLVMALSLLPAGALAAGLPFTDVKTSDWFYNDVKNAYDDGLINGKTATTFEPNSNLTYAEAVKLAACMNQRNATGMVTLVNGNPWYATYVNYAKDNGIISKDYDWNAKATRAGYMEIFANALPASNLKPINNVPDGSIPDVPMSHPQADAIYTLYRAGILQGSDSQHSCKPNDNIKRSEVAAILTRMMDVKERISFSMAEEVEELTITSQPKDVTCSVGDTAEYTVMAAGGTEPYTYQWQGLGGSLREFKNLVGKTSATLSLSATEDTFKSVSQVRCVITDADGNTVTSNEVKLVKKTEALTITTQPKDVSCSVGDTATFTVAATGGTEPYKYQWQAPDLRYKVWTNITGATSATYTYKNVSIASFSSSIRCVITDADGNTVTSNEAKVVKKTEALAITTQPQNVTTTVGGTATFTVAASGGKAPYTYQWEQYGPNPKVYSWGVLAGATSSACGLVNIKEAQFTYKYRCVITDADGNTVTSNEVKLVKKTEALTITTQPKDVTATIGSGSSAFSAGFTVAVSGGKEPYTYQWQWGKTTGSGWTDFTGSETWANPGTIKTYSLLVGSSSASILTAGYQFRCVITDANGTKVTSNAAKLTAPAPLTITSQPKTVTCSVGDTVSFEVAVSGGTPGYVYEWQFKTASLSSFAKLSTTDTNATGQGTNKITLKVNKNHFTNGTVYKCVIKDANGSTVTTNEVTMKAPSLSVSVGCAGANERQGAMLQATVTGGKAPYTYKWSNGTKETTNATWSSIWVSKGFGGTCTVTDANGTTVSATVQYDPYWFSR